MPDITMEFFYDSNADPKWTVLVYQNRQFAFQVEGNDFEGVMEDLLNGARLNLEELAVAW